MKPTTTRLRFFRVAAAIALAFALGACGGTDHVDFPDGSAPGDGGSSSGGDGSIVSPDGAVCTPNNALDCAGYCGQLVGHCGKIIDCGGCPAGLKCGAKGPNLCGTSACVPSCTGKACGASDGCGTICATGTCNIGQRCSAGSCVCDSSSCSGCCNGTTCLGGNATSACGVGGTACVPCTGTQTCTGGQCQGGSSKCVPVCTANLDCQNSCPPTASGINCCDATTNICFVSATTVCPG